jgi:hypothetical protein
MQQEASAKFKKYICLAVRSLDPEEITPERKS